MVLLAAMALTLRLATLTLLAFMQLIAFIVPLVV